MYLNFTLFFLYLLSYANDYNKKNWCSIIHLLQVLDHVIREKHLVQSFSPNGEILKTQLNAKVY